MAGLQCDKRLWLTVHEPNALESQVDAFQQMLFDHGTYVGEVAREYFSGGVLVDLPHHEVIERVAATKQAIASGASAIYEASFLIDDAFVAVDILHRRGRRWTITEVKSTTTLEPEHIPDVAVQTYVVRQAGLDVARSEIMHLNRECRYPDLDDLFIRDDVTQQVEAQQRAMRRETRRQLRMLDGPEPQVDVGGRCSRPYDCPFLARCWPKPQPHHVGTLYRVGARQLDQLLGAGFESIHDLPDDIELNPIADRQRRAVQSGKLIVEAGLRAALAEFQYPIAFLDFETVALPIPVWPGCRPYDAVAVQLSCHVLDSNGALQHTEWLADSSEDPRRELAHALLRSVRGARTILAYNAPFELGCIQRLREAVPELDGPLARVALRVRDLLPLVRAHVYHPDFGGSFALKSVAPALVPTLSYEPLAIQDGGAASMELERLLFRPTELTQSERAELRTALLAYCRHDTLALVKIVEHLRSLATRGRRPKCIA